MEGLLAALGDASDDDVLDGGGIDAAAVHQRVQHLGAKIGRMPAGELAGAAATGRAYRFDDIGLGHLSILPCGAPR